MRRLVVGGIVTLLAAPVYAEQTRPHEVSLELGLGGPSGYAGLRYSHHFDRVHVGLGAGVLGTSGLMFSITAGATAWTWEKQYGRYTSEYRVGFYGGYSVGLLRDSTRALVMFDGELSEGNYHWMDAGLQLSAILHSLPRLKFGVAVGATILMTGPQQSYDPADEDEKYLRWLGPEYWVIEQGWAPTLWTSVGYRF